jgi:hypothetical protein
MLRQAWPHQKICSSLIHASLGESLLVSLQHLLKLLGCRLLHSRKAVRVRVKCEHNRSVAQSLADDLWILIRSKKKCRTGVSEIIGADVVQSRLLQKRFEVSSLKVAKR